jgi:hypothetical protein
MTSIEVLRPVRVVLLAGLALLSAGDALAQQGLPTITGVWPKRAAATGGTTIRISGSGFVPGETSVFVGGAPATSTVVAGPDLVLAVAPSRSPAGLAGVAVQTPNGTASLTGAVRYVNVATGATLAFGTAATTELSVYRPSSGEWFVRPLFSSDGNADFTETFGWPGDQPLLGDFDGDGRRDAAVYRPSTGTWFWLQSSSGGTRYGARGWGDSAQGDVPVPGDYDGDFRTDLAVYRPADGTWFVLFSVTQYSLYNAFSWGQPGDIPMPGDYDGDGTTDLCVFRAKYGTWFVLLSGTQNTGWGSLGWGQLGDIPLGGAR